MNCEEIYLYLKENGVYAEVFEDACFDLCILIEWGDWKHDHGFCDFLMSQLGFMYATEEITEEDGSDCYSSKHFYSKIA